MIYINRNNKQEGPYSEEEVRRKISNGELSLTDLGWREGLSNWTRLEQLLGTKVPPPLPTSASPPPLPVAVAPGPIQPSAATAKRNTLLMFLVCALGLLGAFFDLSLGRAIQGKIDSLHADISSVPWYWQLVVEWANEQWGGHFIENSATVANILVICGVIGALTAFIFLLRRYTKILAAFLILCGLGPLVFEYSRPLTFVGFPMLVAGFLGLFVRDKRSLEPRKA